MHGTWSLDLKGRSGLADFSAAMTMELSGLRGCQRRCYEGSDSPDDPQARIRSYSPHHHEGRHGQLRHRHVPYLRTPPATTNPGFMVTGMAKITGNGGPAPFSKGDTVLSTLQVCVNGGTDVPFSNVTLVFGSPASGHFGSQAIHGVVRKAKSPERTTGRREHR